MQLEKTVIVGVHRDDLPHIWPRVTGYLHSVPQEDFSLADIYNLLDRRDGQLWVILRDMTIIGCFVTELVQYPQTKIVRVLFGAGVDAEEWLEGVRDIVIPWAKSHDCSAIEIDGRPGWQRVVNKFFGPGWATQKRVAIRGAI